MFSPVVHWACRRPGSRQAARKTRSRPRSAWKDTQTFPGLAAGEAVVNTESCRRLRRGLSPGAAEPESKIEPPTYGHQLNVTWSRSRWRSRPWQPPVSATRRLRADAPRPLPQEHPLSAKRWPAFYEARSLCLNPRPKIGGSATLSNCLPRFRPSKRRRRVAGAFSRPSWMSSASRSCPS